MKIAIYSRSVESHFIPKLENIFQKLEEQNCEILIYQAFAEHLIYTHNFQFSAYSYFTSHIDLPANTDVMISIGGDGTFLDTITFVRDTGIPIAGINTGKLGFLANISQDSIMYALDCLFYKKYKNEPRTLLEVESSENTFDNFPFALNEVTVQKKGSSMISVHTYLNNAFLNSYFADGLIIATPTGSTAYSLSAGGPIVVPNSCNFIISPIAPHTLSVRPIVISDENQITLHIESRDNNALVSVDHRYEVCNTTAPIVIKKANYSINLVHLENISFYNTLRNKLMWGIDKRT